MHNNNADYVNRLASHADRRGGFVGLIREVSEEFSTPTPDIHEALPFSSLSLPSAPSSSSPHRHLHANANTSATNRRPHLDLGRVYRLASEHGYEEVQFNSASKVVAFAKNITCE